MIIRKQSKSDKLFRMKIQLLPFLLITMLSTAVVAQKSDNIPHLEKQGTATQLIVDGKPFLMIGGELGNSSASDMKYMEWVFGLN
jgi:hypothetical protein